MDRNQAAELMRRAALLIDEALPLGSKPLTTAKDSEYINENVTAAAELRDELYAAATDLEHAHDADEMARDAEGENGA